MTNHDKKLIRQMEEYYAARAPWHEHYMSYGSNENLESTRAPIVAAIEKAVTNRRVLDIACGTGNWTQVLARRATSVLAIDGLNEPLAIARSKKYQGDVIFRCHNAYALDEIDTQFETVFASHWLSHVPYGVISDFLASISRCLVSGGVFISLDLSDGPVFREGMYFDDDGNRIQDRTLPNGRTYPVVKNFPSEDELRVLCGRHFADFAYQEFPNLQNWLVMVIR